MKYLKKFNENFNDGVSLDTIYDILEERGIEADFKLTDISKINHTSDPLQMEVTFPVSSRSFDGRIDNDNMMSCIEEIKQLEWVEDCVFDNYKYMVVVTLKEGREI